MKIEREYNNECLDDKEDEDDDITDSQMMQCFSQS